MSSPHLDQILARRGGAFLQVAFIDVEKFSLRKRVVQTDVLTALDSSVVECLVELGQQYGYSSDPKDFFRDVIKLPTGDGIALVFTIPGIIDANFRFIRAYITKLHIRNRQIECSVFDKNRWCNCHDLFYVRAGLADGYGSVNWSINDAYNAAGPTMNTAARIMDLGDGMQILMSESTFNNVVELERIPELETHHRAFSNVKIKHGVYINVYQYCPDPANGVNVEVPTQLRPLSLT